MQYHASLGIDRFQDELRTGFDIVFSVGTSAVFDYIAWPIELARRSRIPTVEINPGTSEISEIVDIKLPLPAGEALEAIWRVYRSE